MYCKLYTPRTTYRGLRARTHQLQIRLNAANRKTKFATRCKIS